MSDAPEQIVMCLDQLEHAGRGDDGVEVVRIVDELRERLHAFAGSVNDEIKMQQETIDDLRNQLTAICRMPV